jgi:hypothetical protein
MPAKHAEATETIAADPGTLYDLVSDLPEMGRWSPEATGGSWVGGATGPAVGARFRGSNHTGWRRWSTSCEVTEADRGKRFAFRVTFGPLPVADWSYDFDSDGTTTRVLEQWDDRRPVWMERVLKPVMGVADRAVHNQRTMALTLTALKADAEVKSA